jgi:3-deoxy-D-manno-octulosonic-acid transferase
MAFVFNAAYILALLLLSPWLVYKSVTTGKHRRGLWRKFRGDAYLRRDDAPCAWFHGVSVGEVHLLQQVVRGFHQRRPSWACVISTSTDTGFDEARKRFPDLPVFYWPLDFSWAVRRALRRVNPSLILLGEGELWPNFLSAAKKRGVPVVLVNGRLSPRSLSNYRRLSMVGRRILSPIDLILAQNEDYAAAYRALGAEPTRVRVTGSVKYDGVQSDRRNPATQKLARLLKVHQDDLVWIAGSTQEPEEEYVLSIFRKLRQQYSKLRLFLVPRQKERFDEVAALLHRQDEPFVRRSLLTAAAINHRTVVLVDTIGELGALWGLADVAYVGGSLDGRRGGQNMIEPAAYGAAVVFGPHVWNFRETASRLVTARAAFQVANAAELEAVVRRLLGDAAERERLGAAARDFVRLQQGATERTLDHLDSMLADHSGRSEAA